jgi:hypothetical protein
MGLDVAAGVVVGQGPDPFSSGDPGKGRNPSARLVSLASTLLAEPPCVIAFSGGRDSSVLLALFVDVARWDDDEASDERQWQEQVVSSIGAKNWEILRPGTDLDLLGVEAVTALGRQGLMWPPPAYAFLPMIRRAAGGTFVSGEGGDEAFGLWPHARFWSAVRHRRIPVRADLAAAVVGCAPRGYRRYRWERALPPYQSWLQPGALAAFGRQLADDQADDPLWWNRYQQVSRRRRAVGLTLATLDGLCASHGTRYSAPLLDTGFLQALGAWGGYRGRGDRTGVMIQLFGDLLPATVLSRTSKASFGGVFWGPESRQFAEEWDGSGLDSRLVDVEALRQAWLSPVPVYGSALPLHAAWLYNHAPRAADLGAAGSGTP